MSIPFSIFLVPALTVLSCALAVSKECDIVAESGSVGVCGSLNNTNIIIGISPEQLDKLIQLRTKQLNFETEEQKLIIQNLKSQLDLNEQQLFATLSLIAKEHPTTKEIMDRLAQITDYIKALKADSASKADDDDIIRRLREKLRKCVDEGSIAQADRIRSEIDLKLYPRALGIQIPDERPIARLVPVHGFRETRLTPFTHLTFCLTPGGIFPLSPHRLPGAPCLVAISTGVQDGTVEEGYLKEPISPDVPIGHPQIMILPN